MKTIHTRIDIDTPADVAYDVLTDFEAYDEWNDYTRIDGVAAPGERLTVAPGPDAAITRTFRPRVRTADESRLRWVGHLRVNGLFDGDHDFGVEDLGDGRSRLTQDERFTGVLAGLLFGRYGDEWTAQFEGVNGSLRERAESLTAGRAAPV